MAFFSKKPDHYAIEDSNCQPIRHHLLRKGSFKDLFGERQKLVYLRMYIRARLQIAMPDLISFFICKINRLGYSFVELHCH